MGETDQQVSQKLHASLAGNLIPTVCVGETLEDRAERQIEYPDEDPWIREKFESELAARGTKFVRPVPQLTIL